MALSQELPRHRRTPLLAKIYVCICCVLGSGSYFRSERGVLKKGLRPHLRGHAAFNRHRSKGLPRAWGTHFASKPKYLRKRSFWTCTVAPKSRGTSAERPADQRDSRDPPQTNSGFQKQRPSRCTNESACCIPISQLYLTWLHFGLVRQFIEK